MTGVAKIRGDLAENVDRLGLQALEVGKVNGHAGALEQSFRQDFPAKAQRAIIRTGTEKSCRHRGLFISRRPSDKVRG